MIAVSAVLLAVTTGLPAAVTAYQVGRNSEDTQRQIQLGQAQQALAERGQVTERFTKATEQLASDKLAVRLGGIYALDKIMRDVPDYQAPAIEVLSAFVRHGSLTQPKADLVKPRVVTDLQAALTVLSSRVPGSDDPTIDLSGAYLPGARLTSRLDLPERPEDSSFGGNFDDADLTGTDLSQGIMVNIKLRGAHMVDMNLTDAALFKSDLSGSLLRRTTLRSAELQSVIFTDATIDRVDLRNARLGSSIITNVQISDSDLRGTQMLSATFEDVEFENVRWNRDTLWPRGRLAAVQAKSELQPDGSFVIRSLTLPESEESRSLTPRKIKDP